MRHATAKGTRRLGPPPRNFHLPLPEGVYEALHQEASRLGRPATVVAREAIELWLQERKRTVVREAIAAYAVQHAGTSVMLPGTLLSEVEAGLRAALDLE
jgi:hypothetical protein